MGKIKMGTVYLNGAPQDTEVSVEKEDLCIGDTIPGKEIQWIRLRNGLLIADRCVCVDVSLDMLNSYGFANGKVISIDGNPYLCRCLKVGKFLTGKEPNEWNNALCEVGESNSIWHWQGKRFWGSDQAGLKGNMGMLRGGQSPWERTYCKMQFRGSDRGFRPALEVLMPSPSDYNPLIGSVITPMGPDGISIMGRLCAVSDYDLMLEPISPLSPGNKWVTQEGDHIIVDRASVDWLKEV